MQKTAERYNILKAINYFTEMLTLVEGEEREMYKLALNALDRMSYIIPVLQGDRMLCPRCGKPYTYRGPGDKLQGIRICNNCGQHMQWGKVENYEI